MPMSWIDVTGYAAALAVLVAFCMTGLIPLRVLAIVSNILFAAYGILAHLYPVFLLHIVLLPINLGKLASLLQGERGALVRSAGAAGTYLPLLPRVRSTLLGRLPHPEL
jgi:hypothetical protein